MVYTTSITAPIFGLRREIDRIFEDAFSGRGDRATWSPVVNVREAANELAFEFELPGLKPDQVEITCDNGILMVRGERRQERKEGDDESRYHIIERSYGAFTRSFQLPQNVDEQQISADFEDGVLSVHVPKAALPQPRKIQIQAGVGSQKNQAKITGQGRAAEESKRGNESGGEKQRGEMAASSPKR
jgi:HSP20 family protein